MKHAATIALGALALLGAGGCRTRTLEIHTEPEGALVWLNDEQVGRTPLEVGFVHHGAYDVRIRMEGYVPLTTQRKSGASFEDQPGVDFVSHSFPGDSRTVWFFTLEPLPEIADRRAAEAALVDRARVFREKQDPGSSDAKGGAQPSGAAGTPATVEPSATSPSTTAPAPTTAK